MLLNSPAPGWRITGCRQRLSHPAAERWICDAHYSGRRPLEPEEPQPDHAHQGIGASDREARAAVLQACREDREWPLMLEPPA